MMDVNVMLCICCTVNAFPLVIFAPDSVQQKLFNFLLQYFDDCEIDGWFTCVNFCQSHRQRIAIAVKNIYDCPLF